MAKKRLTESREAYCQNRVVKKMTLADAYAAAYPKAKNCKRKSHANRAYELEQLPEIRERMEELREQQAADIRKEVSWMRIDAYNNLLWLMEKAKEEIENTGTLSGPCVNAILTAVKELNGLFDVGKSVAGEGNLSDILAAVKGVSDS